MKEPADHLSRARRTFLKTAVAAGGVSVLSTANAAAAEQILHNSKKPAEPEAETNSAGYHETDHIKRYYRTLRE